MFTCSASEFLPFRLNFNFNFKGERKSMNKVINDFCVQFLFSEKILSVALYFLKGAVGK